MNENDLVGSPSEMWNSATDSGRYDTFDWLVDNGFPVDHNFISIVAVGVRHIDDRGCKSLLLWAKERGIVWDAGTYMYAVVVGSLAALQWLRQNDCPWGASVVHMARMLGRDQVVEWLIENGCPFELED